MATTGLLGTLLGTLPGTNPAQNANNAVASAASNVTKTTGQAPIPLSPSLGVQAKAPTTQAPTTTLPKSQINTTPKPTVQATTDGGTESTGTAQQQPAYGQAVYSPQTGQYQGNAAYNIQTGLPLANPNVTPDNSTQAQNVAQYDNPNPQFAAATTGLLGAGLQNSAITNQTQNEVNNIAQQIQALQTGANTQEQAYQSGMVTPRAQGLAQNVASTEANQQTALQGQLTNELAAQQQALTGQSQTQSAEQAAGSLTAPQLAQYGQTSFSPGTGQFAGQGSLPPAVLQQYAQMAASGQYSAIPASITGNPVLSAQLNQAAAAINPSYSPIASTAQGATQAANIQTLGTAPTNTNAQIGSQNQTAAANLSTQLQQFSNLSNTASNFLQSNLGLNPTQIPSMNQSIGSYLANVKNPAAAAAYSLISNDIVGLQTAILGSYGSTTPTAAVQATLQTNPSTLPISQLQTWINTLNQLGGSRLAPLQSTSTAAYGSGTTPYAGTPTTANTSAPTIAPQTIKTLGVTPLNSSEALSGAGMGLLGDVGNFFGGLGSTVAKLFGDL